MRILVQRSLQSNVKVLDKVIGQINHGAVLLVSFTVNDDISDIDYLINKVINLRIFNDENGVMNKSLLETAGEILSISQFTLYADTKKGNRPSYAKALNSIKASELYKIFNEKLSKYVKVETGLFGADMLLDIQNDGPVTILLESRSKNG
jgi:D-tyrosyl-tRNA(Tyr) deacylase